MSELDEVSEIGRTVPEAVLDRFASGLESGRIASPTPGLAGRRLVDLAERWRVLRGEQSLVALAWALRAAARAAAQEREAERVDLVWTGPSGARQGLLRIEQSLLDLVNRSSQHLLLVTFASYPVEELRRALRAALDRGVRVRCVMEHDPAKLRGGSGPGLFDTELRSDVEVLTWPTTARDRTGDAYGALHAKCAVADDRELLVSSANLTGHALSLNIELGVCVRGGAVPGRVREHFDDLVRTGVLVLS